MRKPIFLFAIIIASVSLAQERSRTEYENLSNLVWYVPFDTAAEVNNYAVAEVNIPTWTDQDGSPMSPNGCMMQTMPSESGGGAPGKWINRNWPGGATFGPGDSFSVAWRQKFSPEFVKKLYNGQGFKSVIVYGDTASSCQGTQFVMEQAELGGIGSDTFPFWYKMCGPKLRLYWGGANSAYYYQWPVRTEQEIRPNFYENDPIKFSAKGLQDPDQLLAEAPLAANEYMVAYPADDNDNKPFKYFANEWMWFCARIQIGDWHENNSTFDAWMAREGQPASQIVHLTGVRWNNTASRFGSIQLLLYDTGKDDTIVHEPIDVWYDDLVIRAGTTPIPPPTGEIVEEAPPAAQRRTRIGGRSILGGR